MIRDSAAAARFVGCDQRDADCIEQPRHRRIDRGSNAGLYTALEHEHAARVPRAGPRGGVRARGNLALPARRQQRTGALAQAQERREQPGVRDDGPQSAPKESLQQPAPDFLLDDRTADVDQPAVLYAGRTGGLTRAAGETAIEMELRALSDRSAFEKLFHQVNAPARAIELVAEPLI